MAEATLILSASFSAVAAGVYAFVGARLGRRRVSPDSALAARFFGVWWYGLAGVSLTGGMLNALAGVGIRDFPLHLSLTISNFLVLYAALLGLLYYLVYVFTGRKGAIVPITVFYGLFYVTTLYLILASGPTSVEVARWGTKLVYATPVAPIVALIFMGFLVLPQILAAGAYFSLYFKLRDRTQRYRVLLVATSVAVWFASPLVALASGSNQSDAWQIASRLLGLAAAFTILIAYYPPAAIRRRLGVSAIETAPARGAAE